MCAPRRDWRGTPLACGHLTFNGKKQIRIAPADDVDMFGHAGDDADLAVRLNAVRRAEVGEQTNIPGVDHFVDKAADELLVEVGLSH